MKENSIEEIIKQLELILKVRKEQKEIIECAGGSCINCDPDIKALSKSIEILLDYKRVLKENEELKKSKITYEKVRDIQEKNRNIVDNKYIPTQKIKEIIDRIDYDIEKTKEIISKNTSVYATYRKNDYQIVRLRAMNIKSLDIKKRLKKLLESEK